MIPEKLFELYPTLPFARQSDLLAYAEVLVQAGLGGGTGIDAGDTVLVNCNQYVGEHFLPYLTTAIIQAGGHTLPNITIEHPPGIVSSTLIGMLGSTQQRTNLAGELTARTALFGVVQHQLTIKAPLFIGGNPFAKEGGVTERVKATKPLTDLRRKFTEEHWKSATLGYLPTEALARESDCSITDVWEMITSGCQLASASPSTAVRESLMQSRRICDWLNSLKIRSLAILGENVDLKVELHESAIWRGGTGANIPSFECFTTPMASLTEGWVNFAYPIYYANHAIGGLKLKFEAGRIVSWTADTGQDGFVSMQKLENADRLGEVAFTDSRLSRIIRPIPRMPMCIENIAGTGHVALGNGYKKCLRGPAAVADMNESKPHKDGVFTGKFTATAQTADGQKMVIFSDGQYATDLS